MAQFNAFQNNPYLLQQNQIQQNQLQQPNMIQQHTMQQQVNNQNNTNIIWVQGIEGAKAYPVLPGGAVVLWDTEQNVVYVKIVDMSGIPQPIRTFEYNERVDTQQQSENKGYVTEERLNEILDEKFASFAQSLKGSRVNKKYANQKGGRNYGESAVQSS